MNRDLERAIEWDCAQLIQKFYGYLDEKRYQDLADLFAEDGTWVRLGKPVTGPDAIMNLMEEREDWITTHVVTNLRVIVRSEDEVETVQYVTLYRHEGWDANDGPAPVVLPLGVLRHHDTLVRHNGIWKFRKKTSKAMMVDRERVTHYDRK
jgi:SnoaL-like domain